MVASFWRHSVPSLFLIYCSDVRLNMAPCVVCGTLGRFLDTLRSQVKSLLL